MMKKALWPLCSFLAIAIGFYPLLYFFIDRKFGLLSTKSDALLADALWNVGFYIHILLGGLALLTGWIQFSSRIRNTRPALHRTVGKIYVASVFASSAAGFFIAFFATGGLVSVLGFMCLALVWFSTTLMAYRYIRKKKVERHQKMMTYSYAACFAAVTLRIWTPLLTAYFGDFITAYHLVAWLCWVPNLLVAAFLTRKMTAHQV